MMFPSDFLLLLALLREVVDRAHGGHGGLHGGGGGGGRASTDAQGARNSNCVQKLKKWLFGHVSLFKGAWRIEFVFAVFSKALIQLHTLEGALSEHDMNPMKNFEQDWSSLLASTPCLWMQSISDWEMLLCFVGCMAEFSHQLAVRSYFVHVAHEKTLFYMKKDTLIVSDSFDFLDIFF